MVSGELVKQTSANNSCKLGEASHQFVKPNLFLKPLAACIYMLVALLPTIAHAQYDTPEPIVDWQKKVEDTQRLTTLDNGLMGDRIDNNTGSVTFEHTDVSLPGNNNLAVAVTRRLSRGLLYDKSSGAEFGDWEIVVPRISAITVEASNFRTGARCSDTNQFQDVDVEFRQNTNNPYSNPGTTTPKLFGYQYSSGLSIDTPEFGSESVLYANAQPPTPFPAGTKYNPQ